MIRKSQYKIDLPKDISLYLFIMAAIISVPPVLPLWVKTIPIPAHFVSSSEDRTGRVDILNYIENINKDLNVK